jgi:hypothetical protein
MARPMRSSIPLKSSMPDFFVMPMDEKDEDGMIEAKNTKTRVEKARKNPF